ncbi:MAG: FecR domain-containing protein [Opitutae bacterium]|nr:FecR domain-containing protein [Opitutae bacterium]
MNTSHRHLDPAAEEQAALWAARLDGSALSAADRAALDAWLAENPAHRPLLSSYCQFSADLEQQLPLLEGIKDLSAESRKAPKTAQPHPWLRWPTLAGAMLTAAAAVALVFWLGRPARQSTDIASPAAHRQAVTLADGTRVELNARTSLRIEIGGAERRVRLADGEAFFSVSKDKARPFYVETPAGSVRVTGTTFNVRTALPSFLEVTVVEGSVLVRPGEAPGKTASPVALTRGNQLSSDAQGVAVQALSERDLENSLAWRRGQIVFAGVPLHAALAQLARYHGRSITASADVAELRVGGRYSLDDLDGFLAGLEQSFPTVRVTRDPDGSVRVIRRLE